MILYFFIFIIIGACAFYDWKRTVLVWLPVSMLFNECVCLRYQPPALTVLLAVNFTILALYYLREEGKNKYLSNRPFFFRHSFIAYLISYSLSIVFSIVPFASVFTNTIQYFVNTFVVVFLFHKALKSLDDIKLFIKSALLVFIPIVVLGIYEVAFHDNPWLDYVYLSVPDVTYIFGKMYYVPPFINASGDLSMRYGMVRAYSFFNIHIGFGCACVLYLFLFLYLFSKKYKVKNFFKSNALSLVSLLCFIGILLSNSKTPMVGLPFFLFAALSYDDFFYKKFYLFLSVLAVVVIVLLVFNNNIFDNFISLFDLNQQKNDGGSNVYVRAKQFEVGWRLFLDNPLFGNGIGSISLFLKNYVKNADLLGSESSWLKILPQQGLVGVVAYFILYKEMFDHLLKSTGKTTAIFFCTGLILMETATGFMNFSIYAPILITIERYYQLKNKRNVLVVSDKNKLISKFKQIYPR